MLDDLRITASSVDITPPFPCMLQGYAGRDAPFERVADPVEINALRLSHRGRTAIVYSADVLFLNSDIATRMEQAIKNRLPGEDAAVFAAATHTHGGPGVDVTKPLLGDPSPDYLRWFEDRCGAVVDSLVANPGEPGLIRFRSCTAPFNMNRRRRGWRISRRSLPRRTMIIAPNFDGPKDDCLRIVTLEGDDGRPIAVLWNYACHPAMFPLANCVSADFPGVVRAAIRARLGDPTLPVVYLQGFSGDVLPTMLGTTRGWRQQLLRFLNGTMIGEISLLEFQQWSGSLADCARRCLDEQPGELIQPGLQFGSLDLPLPDLIDGGNDGSLRIQSLDLGRGLCAVGLSAEVVTAYGDALKQLLPGSRVLPVGCLGSTYGYLPTNAMLAEGGYEVEEFFRYFSLPGRFKPAIEDYVCGGLRRLLQNRPIG